MCFYIYIFLKVKTYFLLNLFLFPRLFRRLWRLIFPLFVWLKANTLTSCAIICEDAVNVHLVTFRGFAIQWSQKLIQCSFGFIIAFRLFANPLHGEIRLQTSIVKSTLFQYNKCHVKCPHRLNNQSTVTSLLRPTAFCQKSGSFMSTSSFSSLLTNDALLKLPREDPPIVPFFS